MWQLTDLPRSDAIRFATGERGDRRSATWRFWGNKKGDFYLAARTLGGSLKTSLHRDGKCHTGLTSTYSKAKRVPQRHLDRWTIPQDRATKAVHVIMPEADLTLYSRDEKDPMRWLRTPALGAAAFATIVVLPTDQLVALGDKWPGSEQGTEPVGIIVAGTRAAFVVHWEVPLSPEMQKELERLRLQVATIGASIGVKASPGLRAVLIGDWTSGGEKTNALYDVAFQPAA